MSNDKFKELAQECISLDDIYDKCENCGWPILLHQEGDSDCTRTVEESAEVIAKNWSDLKKRLKPLLKKIKEERRKEAEQTTYLDGLERVITQIHGQNTSNMNLYKEDMTTLVKSLKDFLRKGSCSTCTDGGFENFYCEKRLKKYFF